MSYQLLCSDLDGTLLSTKSDVSDFTIAQIARIKNHMQIILVSARMPKAMRYLQEDLAITYEPIICYNGALVIAGDKELASVVISADQLQLIYQMAKPFGILLGLYHKDEWYVSQDSERVQKEIKHTKCEPIFKDTSETISAWQQQDNGAHKIMLMGTKESSDVVFRMLQQQLKEHLNLYRSNDTLIEIVPKSISKLGAIQSLLSSNQSMRDVIAFGDNYNDIDMLQAAGCGVAVANARAEVKAIANHIARKNTEEGVAIFIEQHL